MSSSYPKVKGFRKDKRSLLESTNRLVIFGEGVRPQDKTYAPGRRLLQRGSVRQTRRVSKTKPVNFSLAGSHPASAKPITELTDYFANTKPWKDKVPESRPPETSKCADETCGDSVLKETDPVAVSEPPSAWSRDKSEKTNEPFYRSRDAFVEAVCCPVCRKTFSENPHPMEHLMKNNLAAYQLKNGLAKKTLESNWGTEIKKSQVPPEQVVVVANCGELFHKICLRDWCCRAHKVKSGRQLTTCPSCGGELKFTSCQEVEVTRSFGKETSPFLREYTKALHVNKELNLMFPETNKYLGQVQYELEVTECNLNDLMNKRSSLKENLQSLTEEDVGVVMSSLTDSQTLRVSLQKQEHALDFMRQETQRIMRMYLRAIIKKLRPYTFLVRPPREHMFDPDFATAMGQVPKTLAPYLHQLIEDSDGLSLLSRILVPLDDADARQKQAMEEMLVSKYSNGRPLSSFIRPQTYVVVSSAAEVGETEEEEEENTNNSKAFVVESENRMASPLRHTSGSHEISVISSNLEPNSKILEANSITSRFILAEKPPQIVEIMNIPDPLLKDDFPHERSNYGGIVNKWKNHYTGHEHAMHPTSGEIASDERDSNREPLNVNEYAQDSKKYVRAIRDLIENPLNEELTEIPSLRPKPSGPLFEFSELDELLSSVPSALEEKESPVGPPQSESSPKSSIISSDYSLQKLLEFAKPGGGLEPGINHLYKRDGPLAAKTSSTTSAKNPVTEQILAFMRKQQLDKKCSSLGISECSKILRFDGTLSDASEKIISDSGIPKEPSIASMNGGGEGVLNVEGIDEPEKPEEPSSIPPENQEIHLPEITNPSSHQGFECNLESLSESKVDPVLESKPAPLPEDNCEVFKESSAEALSKSNPDPLTESKDDLLPEVKLKSAQVHSNPEDLQDSPPIINGLDDLSITIMYVIDDGEYPESDIEQNANIDEITSKNAKDSVKAIEDPKDLSCVHLTAGKTSTFSILAREYVNDIGSSSRINQVSECPRDRRTIHPEASITPSECNTPSGSLSRNLLRLSSSWTTFTMPSKRLIMNSIDEIQVHPRCVYENETNLENKKVTGN